MGSWNKTCGITQFPIHSGDDVVTFILVQNEFGGDRPNPCYSNEYWNVIPMPIYGQYNDYGWMDVDDGQDHKIAFLKEHYKDAVVVNKEQAKRVQMCYASLKGKNKGPFDSWEALGDAIHGHAFFLKNRLGGWKNYPKNLSFASFMVSRKVWDALTATYTVDYPEKKTYTKADLVAGIEKFFAYTASKKAELEKLQKESDEAPDDVAREAIRLLAFDLIHSSLSSSKYIKEVFKDKTYNNPVAGVIQFICDRIGSESPVIELKELTEAKALNAEDAASMYLLWCAMRVLRKSWFPQSGEGSQCGIEEQHLALVKVMGEMIEHEKTRWDDE